VVGEGWHREVSPYPDLRRQGVIDLARIMHEGWRV
jgi:hypothetical protein